MLVLFKTGLLTRIVIKMRASLILILVLNSDLKDTAL